MRLAGQIVLVPFPFTNLSEAKLRPVLALRRASSRFDDWLVCMISSQLHQAEPDFDEILRMTDEDFQSSGLKASSALRIRRMAVIDGGLIVGDIGAISQERLDSTRRKLAHWLLGEEHDH
jgi:mRNA interferase MazF